MSRAVALAAFLALCAGTAEAAVVPVVNESTGDLSLTYSLSLPRARGRVQPSLDLVYSSGSAEDRGYGVGWALSAHYIERETRGGPGTNYLWLAAGNSRRLLVQAGTAYRAEVEDAYFEITANPDGTFTAKDGAGNTYSYSRAFGTRMYLTKVADLDGNEVLYGYVAGREDLSTIEYNKTPGGVFAARIDLVFASVLSPPPRAAVAGVLATRESRLVKVTIAGLKEIGGHRVIGGYTLGYASVGAGAVVLESVTEFGGNSVASRPPTVFQYNSNAFDLDSTTQTIQLQAGSLPTWMRRTGKWADLDGDGLTDAVWTEGLASNSTPQLHWARNRTTPAGGVAFDAPVAVSEELTGGGAELLDFNGDGILDLVQPSLENGRLKHRIYLGSFAGGAFAFLPVVVLDVTDVYRMQRNPSTLEWYAAVRADRTALVDLNGDGVLDYARIPGDGHCGTEEPNTTQAACAWEYGLTQIHGTGAPTVRKSTQILDGVPGGEWWTRDDHLATWLGMDVNGDGLSDAVRNDRFASAAVNWSVVHYWTSTLWRVALNTGLTAAGTLDFSLGRGQEWGNSWDLAGYADAPDMTVTSPTDTTECGQRTADDVRFTIADLLDLNGDGKPDFVRRLAESQQQISWNTGSVFDVLAEPRNIANARGWPRFNPDGMEVQWNATVNCGPANQYRKCWCEYFGPSGQWGEYVDVTGDGVLDFVLSGEGDPTTLTIWRGLSPSGVSRAVMLRQVTVPDGATYDVDYVPATWFGARQSRRAVVSRVGIRDAFVAPNSTYYWYAGAVEARAWYDPTKPDDRGFAESWSQDATTRVVSHTRWRTDSRPLVGRALWTESGVAAALGIPATLTTRGIAPTGFTVFAKQSFQYGWKSWDNRWKGRSCAAGVEPTPLDYPVRVVATLSTDESRYDGLVSTSQIQRQVSCEEVDEFGRIHQVTTTPSIGGVPGAPLVTVSEFNDPNPGCVNAPLEFRLIQRTSGGTLSEDVTLYDSLCRPTQTYSPTTSGDTKRVSYVYGGPFGQLTDTTTGGVTTRVLYDAQQGLHVLEEQIFDLDEEGRILTLLATVYSVDYATGLRTSVQGPRVLWKDGVTVPNVSVTKRFHVYDVFGRPVAVSKAPPVSRGEAWAAYFVPGAAEISQAVELNRYDDTSMPRSVRSYRYSVMPTPFDPAAATPATDDASETIVYRDGLGRVIQVRERIGGGGTAESGAQVLQSLSGYKVAKAVFYDGAGRERVSLEPFYVASATFADFSVGAIPPTRATVTTYDDQPTSFAGLRRGSAWCRSYEYVSGALPGPSQTCTSNSSGTNSFRLATEARHAIRRETQRVEYGGNLIAVDVITPEVNAVGGSQAKTTYLDPAGRELGSRDAEGRYTWLQLDDLGREIRSWRASATHATPEPATEIGYNAAGQVESVWDANSPSVRKVSRYDESGRLILVEWQDKTTELPTGDRLVYEYELGDLGRLTEIREYRNGGPPTGTLVARNQYDVAYNGDLSFEYMAGKLSATSNDHSTVVYGYDDAGRVKRRDQYFAALPGRRFTVDSLYAADGRVLSSQVVNPYNASSGFRYDVHYDSAGRPVQLSGKLTSATDTTVFYGADIRGSPYGAYDAAGRVLTMRADGVQQQEAVSFRVVSARRYNPYSGALDGECKRFGDEVDCMATPVDPSQDIYRSDQVAFEYAGSKLKSFTDSLTGTRYDNTYNLSGRLTTATAVPAGGPTTILTQDWSEGFQFNGIGNIDYVTRLRNFNSPGRTWSLELADYVPGTHGGATMDRVDSVQRQIQYSQPTAEASGTTAYEYDVLGHLTKVTRTAGESEELYYAPGGELLYRKVAGKYVFYVGEYATVTADAAQWSGHPDEATVELDGHVVFAGTRIASVKPSRTLYYYRSRLGSVVATSIGGTNERAEYRYTPYGELELTRYSTTDPQVQKKLSSELGYTNGLRLTGQLIYLQTRVYDAEARVFVQPDRVDMLRYAYVQGDPINYWDPTGTQARDAYENGSDITVVVTAPRLPPERTPAEIAALTKRALLELLLGRRELDRQYRSGHIRSGLSGEFARLVTRQAVDSILPATTGVAVARLREAEWGQVGKIALVTGAAALVGAAAVASLPVTATGIALGVVFQSAIGMAAYGTGSALLGKETNAAGWMSAGILGGMSGLGAVAAGTAIGARVAVSVFVATPSAAFVAVLP